MFETVLSVLRVHLETQEQRETLIRLAFPLASPVRSKIDYSGTAVAFTTRLIETLQAHGEVMSGVQALWHLLTILRDQVGLDEQHRIDEVETWANHPHDGRPATGALSTPSIWTGDITGENINIGGTQIIYTNGPGQGGEIPPSFIMEDLPDGFVKRQREFDALVQALTVTRDEAGSLTIALTGAAGYGKTTIALDVCHDARVQQVFNRGIFWVTLGEKVSENDVIAKILDLVVKLTGSRPPVITLEAAQHQLKKAVGDQTLLLVADDVWAAEHLAPFLNPGPHACTLITTRNSRILSASIPTYAINAMQPSEALNLLGADLEDMVADELQLILLTTRLGEWPLLLKLVNRQLVWRVSRGQTLRQALGWVEEALELRGFDAFTDPSDPQERQRAVSASLGVSVDLLDNGQRRRFECLAIFPEDIDIPLETLQKLWVLNALEVEELAELLFGLSLLLKYDLNTGLIRLHDVVRTYLRQRPKPELIDWNRAFLANYCLTSWRELAANEPYLWLCLAYHLREAQQDSLLRELLLDPVFLQGKLNATHVNALLQDYAIANASVDGTLCHLESAVRMSAHILSEDKTALAHQLVGRLMSHRKRNDEIRTITEGVAASIRGLYPLDLDSPLCVLNQAGGALLRLLTGHTHQINHVALVSDSHALSASSDGRLIMWDLNSGSRCYTFEEHTRGIKHVMMTSRSRAISASDDHSLVLWDVDTGHLLHRLKGHNSGVTHVALSDHRIISASHDHTLKIWDVDTGQLLHTLEGHSSSVMRIAAGEGRVVSASDDYTLKVWDLNTGRFLHTLSGHSGGVTCAILMSQSRVLSSSYDHTLILWDLTTGEMLRKLEGHTREVTHVTLIDHDRAISASDDSTLLVWDLTTGQILYTLSGHTDRVNYVTLIDEQHALSTSDDATLIVWDLATGRALYKLTGHANAVNHVVLTQRGHAVSASDDGRLIVWDLNLLLTATPDQMGASSFEGVEASLSHGYASAVTHIVVTDDGRAISASSSETLIVWDLTQGHAIQALQGHTSGVNHVILTKDGGALSGSNDQTLILWDLTRGNPIYRLQGHTSWINSIALWGADHAVSASFDRNLIVWDLRNGTQQSIFQRHTRGVNRVVVTETNDAISASEDGTLMIWNLTTGSHTGTLESHTRGVNHVAVIDHKRVVSASKDNSLIVWNLETRTALHLLQGHTSSVDYVSWTGNDRLVSTAYDEIIVWDLETGRRLALFDNSLPGRTALLQTFPDVMAFEGFIRHADGHGLMWIDNVLSVHMASGNPLAIFYTDSTITAAAWSLDGKTIIVGDDFGRIFFLRAPA